MVARQYDVNANPLFGWSKVYQTGGLSVVLTDEEVVAASQFAAVFKQIQDLHRMLGKKTMEGEIVREAVEYGRSKKWIACSLLLSVDDQ